MRFKSIVTHITAIEELAGIIILCFASRGLHALAVAYEGLDGDDHEAEGCGFELIGLLTIFDPPHADTKETIPRLRCQG